MSPKIRHELDYLNCTEFFFWLYQIYCRLFLRNEILSQEFHDDQLLVETLVLKFITCLFLNSDFCTQADRYCIIILKNIFRLFEFDHGPSLIDKLLFFQKFKIFFFFEWVSMNFCQQFWFHVYFNLFLFSTVWGFRSQYGCIEKAIECPI